MYSWNTRIITYTSSYTYVLTVYKFLFFFFGCLFGFKTYSLLQYKSISNELLVQVRYFNVGSIFYVVYNYFF